MTDTPSQVELAQVELVDEVVLPLAEADGWLDRWRRDYLPGAQERGLVLRSVARRFAGPDSAAIRITWSLPNPYAFYLMRGAAAADPHVARFWADTDAVAESRQRHALELEAVS